MPCFYFRNWSAYICLYAKQLLIIVTSSKSIFGTAEHSVPLIPLLQPPPTHTHCCQELAHCIFHTELPAQDWMTLKIRQLLLFQKETAAFIYKTTKVFHFPVPAPCFQYIQRWQIPTPTSKTNTSSQGDLPNKPKSCQSSVEVLDTTRPNKFPSSSNSGLQFFLPPLSVTSSP